MTVMQRFYQRALIALFGLLALCVVVGYLCVQRSYLHLSLLPLAQNGLSWRAETSSDATEGGLSAIHIVDDRSTLSFDFKIVRKAPHPFAAAALAFNDAAGKTNLLDFSRYSTVSFSAKCTPSNTLTLGMLTFHEKISVPDKFLTYRNPSAYFSCNQDWSSHELDLTRLETPQWWYEMFKLNLSRQEYKLDKVAKIRISSTVQSATETVSKVQLTAITLAGRDWRYVYLLGVFVLLAGAAYVFWFFRAHAHALITEVKEKIQKDRPILAYQQLSVELHVDKEKSAILHFMATEYASPDLDLESMVAAVGVNRNKINEILKSELGYTFIAYLNKLRLTEAARLLGEKDEANVAQIAYSVGYKNVSYFNKLFKEEYLCTPKAFRNLSSR